MHFIENPDVDVKAKLEELENWYKVKRLSDHMGRLDMGLMVVPQTAQKKHAEVSKLPAQYTRFYKELRHFSGTIPSEVQEEQNSKQSQILLMHKAIKSLDTQIKTYVSSSLPLVELSLIPHITELMSIWFVQPPFF